MRLSAALVVTSVVFFACPPPVTPAPLTVTPPSLAVDLGATKVLSASINGGPAYAAAWSTSDAAVATVKTNGDGTATVRALREGTATITATVGDSTATSTVTVGPAVVTRIELSPGRPSLALGTKLQLQATAVASDGTKRDVTAETTWRTAGTTALTVSASGEVTSVALGSEQVSGVFDGRSAAVTVTVTDARLTSIDVTPATNALITGTTQQLTASGVFSNGTRQNLTTQVTWRSSATNVATVDSLGVVRAVAMGGATITATRGDVQATASVTTTTAVLTSIEVTPAPLSLALGLTRQLVVTGRYDNGLSQPVTNQATFSSSATATATVSAQGLVTARALGTSTVTVSVGSFTTTTEVTVTAAEVAAITVTPASPSVAAGLTQQLTATARMTDTTTQDVTTQVVWASATSATATVSNAVGSEGLATGVAEGTSVVSATLNAVSGSVTLTVTAPVLSSIDVTPDAPILPKGRTQQFTATGVYSDTSTQDLTAAVTWASSDAGVLGITDGGFATALYYGVVTVTATSGAVTGSTTAQVDNEVVESMVVTPSPASVAKTASVQLAAIATMSDATVIEMTYSANWASADAGVATVTTLGLGAGLATGVEEGVTEITATIGTVVASTTLTVTKAPLTSITLTPAAVLVGIGGTQQMTATGHYADGSSDDITQTVTWATGAQTTATVDATGLVTGVQLGVTSVSATVGSVTANVVVTVAL